MVFGALLQAEASYAAGIPMSFHAIGRPGEFTMPGGDHWGVQASGEPVQLYAIEINPPIDSKSYSVT